MTDEVTRKYTTINDVLNRYASQAWRNADTAETFPHPLQQRVEELEAALRALLFAADLDAELTLDWYPAAYIVNLQGYTDLQDASLAAARALGES
jgi:hypothetical protein